MESQFVIRWNGKQFVKTISEYGTPSTLGKRIGFDVFTTEIHRYATVAPVAFGKAATLSSVLIGVCLCMWLLQNYITTRRTYNLVSGKGKRFAEVKLPAVVNVLPLYNTMGILVLAYVVLFLPYTIQYVTSSFSQVSGSLMAAGQVFVYIQTNNTSADKEGRGGRLDDDIHHIVP